MPINRRYDTFFKRLIAGIIDGFVFLPLNYIGVFLVMSQGASFAIAWPIIETVCWTLYIVIGHGKYGQTLGKRAMAIKVLDLYEKNTIGYKRAFIRESVWFLTSIVGSIYFLFTYRNTDMSDYSQLDDYLSLTTTLWFILEILTMFLNPKRRALHDLMAKSVVIDMDVVKREEYLQTREPNRIPE